LVPASLLDTVALAQSLRRMNYSLRLAAEHDKELVRTLTTSCYRDVVAQQFGGWDPALHVLTVSPTARANCI
jgi:hypothetical protein